MQRLATLGLFVLLAVAHTWPLAQRPNVHSRVDNGDYCLNVWAVDWVARTLPTDPVHLFDANIFYPARLTLAYSEPLILQGALAIPAEWLGVSPLVTFNLLLIVGQTIPRGGALAVDPVGAGESMGFRITASGVSARIPQAVPALLQGTSENGSVDAHAIQPFYAGLLARACGLEVTLKAEGDMIVIATADAAALVLTKAADHR